MTPVSNNLSGKMLRRGHRVVIRSFAEIAQTLDANGALDGLPFMPEMLPYCGHAASVSARLDKICVESPWFQFRRLEDVVTLEGLECSGSAHGGCQRSCRILWKQAWLRAEDDVAPPFEDRGLDGEAPYPSFQTQRSDSSYVCQSSELPVATLDPVGSLRIRWFSELAVGNVSAAQSFRRVVLPLWLLIREHFTGIRPHQMSGRLKSTPRGTLGLQPGDWVEIKSLAEIQCTLDKESKNRGLSFTRLKADFCGKRAQVKCRVEKFILEGSGEMRTVSDTVILENLTCDGCIFPGGCSRGAYHFWREIWLRPLREVSDSDSGHQVSERLEP
jgi:hypothetical protein